MSENREVSMDYRTKDIIRKLEWFAKRKGVGTGDVVSLKFRPILTSGEPTQMSSTHYEAVRRQGAVQQLPWTRDMPFTGVFSASLLPMHDNSIWVENETGLEFLLTFEFLELLKTAYDTAKGFVELTGNPLLFVDLMSLTLSRGRDGAAGDVVPQIATLQYEARSYRDNGELRDEVIVKIPVGAETFRDPQQASAYLAAVLKQHRKVRLARPEAE
ncbi:hypothetical protein ACVMIX_006626 [Rhizobium leguminosarum]